MATAHRAEDAPARQARGRSPNQTRRRARSASERESSRFASMPAVEASAGLLDSDRRNLVLAGPDSESAGDRASHEPPSKHNRRPKPLHAEERLASAGPRVPCDVDSQRQSAADAPTPAPDTSNDSGSLNSTALLQPQQLNRKSTAVQGSAKSERNVSEPTSRLSKAGRSLPSQRASHAGEGLQERTAPTDLASNAGPPPTPAFDPASNAGQSPTITTEAASITEPKPAVSTELTCNTTAPSASDRASGDGAVQAEHPVETGGIVATTKTASLANKDLPGGQLAPRMRRSKAHSEPSIAPIAQHNFNKREGGHSADPGESAPVHRAAAPRSPKEPQELSPEFAPCCDAARRATRKRNQVWLFASVEEDGEAMQNEATVTTVFRNFLSTAGLLRSLEFSWEDAHQLCIRAEMDRSSEGARVHELVEDCTALPLPLIDLRSAWGGGAARSAGDKVHGSLLLARCSSPSSSGGDESLGDIDLAVLQEWILGCVPQAGSQPGADFAMDSSVPGSLEGPRDVPGVRAREDSFHNPTNMREDDEKVVVTALRWRFAHCGRIKSVEVFTHPHGVDYGARFALLRFSTPSEALKACEDWERRGLVIDSPVNVTCVHLAVDLFDGHVSGRPSVAHQQQQRDDKALASQVQHGGPSASHHALAVNKRTRSTSPGSDSLERISLSPVKRRDALLQAYTTKRTRNAPRSAARLFATPSPEPTGNGEPPMDSKDCMPRVHVTLPSECSMDQMQSAVVGLSGFVRFRALERSNSADPRAAVVEFSTSEEAELAREVLDGMELLSGSGKLVEARGKFPAQESRKKRTGVQPPSTESSRGRSRARHDSSQVSTSVALEQLHLQERPEAKQDLLGAPSAIKKEFVELSPRNHDSEGRHRASAETSGSKRAGSRTTPTQQPNTKRIANLAKVRRQAEQELKLELELARRAAQHRHASLDDNADHLADTFKSAVRFQGAPGPQMGSDSGAGETQYGFQHPQGLHYYPPPPPFSHSAIAPMVQQPPYFPAHHHAHHPHAPPPHPQQIYTDQHLFPGSHHGPSYVTYVGYQSHGNARFAGPESHQQPIMHHHLPPAQPAPMSPSHEVPQGREVARSGDSFHGQHGHRLEHKRSQSHPVVAQQHFQGQDEAQADMGGSLEGKKVGPQIHESNPQAQLDDQRPLQVATSSSTPPSPQPPSSENATDKALHANAETPQRRMHSTNQRHNAQLATAVPSPLKGHHSIGDSGQPHPSSARDEAQRGQHLGQHDGPPGGEPQRTDKRTARDRFGRGTAQTHRRELSGARGVSPTNSQTDESAPLETSRLYVVYPRPIPEEALREAFSEVAPGLEYVSRPRDKCFVFVKYSSEAAAKLAMLRLNGKEVNNCPIKISIAQPPRNSGSRKRQRTYDGGGCSSKK